MILSLHKWGAYAVDLGTANEAKRLEDAALPSRTARRVILYAPTTNSDAVSIGPDSNADYFPELYPGQSYLIDMPQGGIFTINEWYGKSAAANQIVKVLYV